MNGEIKSRQTILSLLHHLWFKLAVAIAGNGYFGDTEVSWTFFWL
jgi:hypothetical protein